MGCASSSLPPAAAVKDEQVLDDNGKPRYPLRGSENIMKRKGHGRFSAPVHNPLRWGCDHKTADRICNCNRHLAEYWGYFKRPEFLKEFQHAEVYKVTISFYDSNTGHLLFEAPKGRTHKKLLD